MEKRNAAGLTETEFLSQYNPGDYERPSVTVDMIVLKLNPDLTKLQVLLIQRKDHPCIGQWALPGGFIGIKESAYEAACRELKEETGLTGVYLEQLYTMSQPDRDPRMRVIDIAYIALLPYGADTNVTAGDDAGDAKWFDISVQRGLLRLSNKPLGVTIAYQLKEKVFKNGVVTTVSEVPSSVSREKLAFDHADILMTGLDRIREKAEHSDIAFNLVPDRFTIPDLQRVYEILLQKPLYKTNFRDKIESRIIPINQGQKTITGNRVAGLYTYKERTL